MTKEAKITWIDVLGAVRGIAPAKEDPFFVDQVATALSMDSKEAARWISKFVDWGYVSRGDFETASSGHRPRRIYYITKYGLEREMPGISDVDRLLQAIQVLREAPDEVREKRALSALFKAHDSVVEERENRFNKDR